MSILEIILLTAYIILLFLFLFYRHEIKKITKQLYDIRKDDTNRLISSSTSNKTTNELIIEINKLLKEKRNEKILYKRKNHNLDLMITNISHDLRTPLTSAMGYINIIRNSDISEDEKNREVEIIEKRLIRLEELLNSFFEFSVMVSTDEPPKTESINLVSVLEEAIVHNYDDYCTQNREIIFDCPKPKIMIVSNKNMLIRIFDNLIGNSLKHGKYNLKIKVNTDKGIKISFENHLSAQNMEIERVFDEFYTTDISRTKGNTGLGLAIAKQFTEMLKGRISASIDGDLFTVNIDFE